MMKFPCIRPISPPPTYKSLPQPDEQRSPILRYNSSHSPSNNTPKSKSISQLAPDPSSAAPAPPPPPPPPPRTNRHPPPSLIRRIFIHFSRNIQPEKQRENEKGRGDIKQHGRYSSNNSNNNNNNNNRSSISIRKGRINPLKLGKKKDPEPYIKIPLTERNIETFLNELNRTGSNKAVDHRAENGQDIPLGDDRDESKLNDWKDLRDKRMDSVLTWLEGII